MNAKLIVGMTTTKRSNTYTSYALRSFFKHTPEDLYSNVILIDNDKTFVDKEFTDHPRITFHTRETPVGYAANANLIIEEAKKAQADVLICNNDIIFTDGWIQPLLVPTNAIVLPVSNAQFPYQHGDFSLKLSMSLNDYLGNEKLFEEIVDLHKKRNGGYKIVHTCPFYCVRIPHSVYSTVGNFDESFGPAFWEDTDYIVRTYRQGIPLVMSLGSFILHFYGKSTWASSRSAEEKSFDEQQANAAEEMFKKKYNEKYVELFGKQTPEALRALRRLEEHSLVELYKHIASTL